ncbi:MAG: hypothetical protein V2A79_00185 [Planctomycetota bacterium]
MNLQKKEELAKALAELIRESPTVRQAVWDCACCCPNLIVEW